jgi:hypothetical protein
VVLRHGLSVSLLACSPGVHTCHTPSCFNLVPVLLKKKHTQEGIGHGHKPDMAQHLSQPAPPSHDSHIQGYITLGGLGKVTG